VNLQGSLFYVSSLWEDQPCDDCLQNNFVVRTQSPMLDPYRDMIYTTSTALRLILFADEDCVVEMIVMEILQEM
jgi:hypothetical protein